MLLGSGWNFEMNPNDFLPSENFENFGGISEIPIGINNGILEIPVGFLKTSVLLKIIEVLLLEIRSTSSLEELVPHQTMKQPAVEENDDRGNQDKCLESFREVCYGISPGDNLAPDKRE